MGMDYIDEIRKEIGANVPSEQLMVRNNSCPTWNNGTIVVALNDNRLHNIPQLKARTEVTVVVPDGFIGKYWDQKISNIGPDSSTYGFWARMLKSSKLTSKFNIEHELNRVQLISDWIEAGCPEYWGINEGEETITDGQKYIIVSTDSSNYSGEWKTYINDEEYLGGCIQDIILTGEFRGSYVDTMKCIINKKLLPEILFTLALKLNKEHTLKFLTIINKRIELFEKQEAEKKANEKKQLEKSKNKTS